MLLESAICPGISTNQPGPLLDKLALINTAAWCNPRVLRDSSWWFTLGLSALYSVTLLQLMDSPAACMQTCTCVCMCACVLRWFIKLVRCDWITPHQRRDSVVPICLARQSASEALAPSLCGPDLRSWKRKANLQCAFHSICACNLCVISARCTNGALWKWELITPVLVKEILKIKTSQRAVWSINILRQTKQINLNSNFKMFTTSKLISDDRL